MRACLRTDIRLARASQLADAGLAWCLQPRRFGLCGMQKLVGAERFDSLDESQAVIKAEPLSGVTAPLDVEAIEADAVEAGEGRIEPSPGFPGKPER